MVLRAKQIPPNHVFKVQWWRIKKKSKFANTLKTTNTSVQ